MQINSIPFDSENCVSGAEVTGGHDHYNFGKSVYYFGEISDGPPITLCLIRGRVSSLTGPRIAFQDDGHLSYGSQPHRTQ
jgi:hypothetical protein